MQKIQVSLHDGTIFTLDVENYNSVELTEMLNNNQLTVVNINGLIVNRNAVKVILAVNTTTTA